MARTNREMKHTKKEFGSYEYFSAEKQAFDEGFKRGYQKGYRAGKRKGYYEGVLAETKLRNCGQSLREP